MITVLKVDIKSSRSNKIYEIIEEFQKLISNRVESKKDKKYSDLLPLQIRNGDELFGVYDNFHAALMNVEAIIIVSKKLNIDIYMGVGIGELANHKMSAHLMNGTAIWNATEALEIAKNDKRDPMVSISKSVSFAIVGDKMEKERDVLHVLFYYLINNILKRTDEQQKAIDLKETNTMSEDADLYKKLKPDSKNDRENNRLNFIRYLTRSDYVIYQKNVESINTLVEIVYGEKS